jgi:hypothetical protein
VVTAAHPERTVNDGQPGDRSQLHFVYVAGDYAEIWRTPLAVGDLSSGQQRAPLAATQLVAR